MKLLLPKSNGVPAPDPEEVITSFLPLLARRGADPYHESVAPIATLPPAVIVLAGPP